MADLAVCWMAQLVGRLHSPVSPGKGAAWRVAYCQENKDDAAYGGEASHADLARFFVSRYGLTLSTLRLYLGLKIVA